MPPTAQEQSEAITQAESQITDFDPETASLEDLRQAALRQEAEPQDQQQDDAPRDEKGRFSAKVEKTENVEEVDEIVYRKVIDLGDGSGVQVFEAPTANDLIEKLATAQENATRKIRELSKPKVEDKPKEVTPEDEWLLSQELLAAPNKTFEKLFADKVGMPISAFKTKMERLNAFEQAQSEENAAKEFMSKHPDFHPSAANAKKIEKYVRTYGLDGTKAESIEQAYLDLNESGLLEVKPATKEDEVVPTTSRIVKPQEPVRQSTTRMSSGISSRRSVAQRGAPEPTEEDIYAMPLDKIRALAISEDQAANS